MRSFPWRKLFFLFTLSLILLTSCSPDRIDQLIGQLKSEKLSERIAAAKELGEIGDPRAIDPLIELIKVAKAEDGEPTLEALKKLDKKIVAEKLIQAFKTSDAEANPDILFCYLSVAGKEAFPLLKDLIRSTDFRTRASAVFALSMSMEPGVVGLLLEAVNDEAVIAPGDMLSTGEMAAKSINLDDDKAVEVVVAAIKGDDPQLRLNALRVTDHKRKYDVAVPALVEFFKLKIQTADQDLVAQVESTPAYDGKLRVSDDAEWVLTLIRNAAYRAVCEAALEAKTLEVVAWARLYFIALGREDAEEALINSLQKFGYVKMVSDFSMSANENLAAAAADWFKGKGIEVRPESDEVSLAMMGAIEWGSMRDALTDEPEVGLALDEAEEGIVGGLPESAVEAQNYSPPSYEARGGLHYPEKARLARVEGRVIVKVYVTKAGVVDQIAVIEEKPSGFDFGEAVKEYLSQCKWKPATLNGKPIDSQLALTLNFTLQ
jgi:bilin biosynthesis protein